MSRSIRVRFPRRSRRKSPPADEPDPAAPEPETAADFASFDPFRPGAADVPDPALTAAERAAAEEEARQGVPASAATAPSPGERRAESRFLEGIARIRGLADGALGRLRAAQHEARTRAVRIEAAATRERERGSALADVQAACQRLDSRYVRSQAAAKELAGFRRVRGIPDYVTPRPPSRGWVWLLLAVAVAETTANGLLLHSASTEGVVSNWLFAALVTGMNVGLLGWVMGDLIFRRMLGAGPLRRVVLAGALLPCVFLAGLLHFGFAHYRDAVQALDASRAAAVVDLDDIDAGAEPGAGAADPHPPPRISVEQAVIGELRAQFLWWRPGASLVDHPTGTPDDHALDSVRQLPAGSVGYRAEDGGLVLVEDPLAGRFEGWRSLLLLGIGFTALLLATWKWFGGREPIPHFARLHAARDATARRLETEYADSLRRLEEDERRHRQRLGDAEADLLALGGRLTGLDAARRQLLAREAELLRLTVAAGASAVEDFREANRQRRLSHDPPPSFWAAPWAPAVPDRDAADDPAWGREHEQGLYEVMEAAERVRIANAAHVAPVTEAFAEARERLAQAARIPGARRRPTGPPGGGSGPSSGGKPAGQEVRLVPRAGQDPAARLEIAS
ncbi:MAG: hypothetical protein F4X79_08095 [Acidobacteria bacterium]|nr:hypothetical protein [Acidobacteriota bacterium]